MNFDDNDYSYNGSLLEGFPHKFSYITYVDGLYMTVYNDELDNFYRIEKGGHIFYKLKVGQNRV